MSSPAEINLDDLVDAIVSEIDPGLIILFGSRGRDMATDMSDLDLVIVDREGFGPGRSRRGRIAEIRKALSPFRAAKDILVYGPDEFEKWKDSVNHPLAEALREGRLLYGRH